ncbi:uncharacterized protein LOC131681642 [Topomyia yanbarensis]|uniref:uncharacterized protein LOC131681642 n=1 Tax=Topomyia yanbarensis TaxID=2498891 RepID=UPI00273B0B30|nr:uncharacterized protein LOC131681642 [Topomyia yanbarensis]
MILLKPVLLPTVKYLLQVRQLSVRNSLFKRAEEIIKQVDPYCKIRIRCNYNLTIAPYDLLDCPDSNILKMTLGSKADDINVESNDNEVNIVDSRSGSPISCLLEIPIKADLEIDNLGDTKISELYSDQIQVRSAGNIVTKNLRSSLIDLRSSRGNISCGGITLAQTIKVVTDGEGNILLNKLQGGDVDAETKLGNISVSSSYCNSSRFKTENGNLFLKNIHKLCRVSTKGSGRLVMNGFYGTLLANVASPEVDLQLSEIIGRCSVTAESAEKLVLAINDTICENAEIAITSRQLEIDPSFDSDQHAEQKKSGEFIFGNTTTQNKLQVEGGKLVQLRKMSWADTLGLDLKMDKT